MPTGYTAIIDENPNTTFTEYLWGCVRAFGVALHMRDDSSRKNFKRPKANTYHQDCLAEAISEKEAFLRLTDAVMQSRLDAEHETELEEYGENLLKYLEVKASYDSMAEQTAAWEITNPEHAGLKDFMLRQLEMGGPSMWPKEEPEKRTLEAWTESKLASFDWNIQYHTEARAKEIEKDANSAKYIDDLIEAVPPPFDSWYLHCGGIDIEMPEEKETVAIDSPRQA